MDSRHTNSVESPEVLYFPASPDSGLPEAVVERINPFDFYQIGKGLRKLARFEGDTAPGAIIWDLLEADSVVANLLKNKPLPLGVSVGAARDLKESLDGILSAHFRAKNAEGKMEFRFPADDAPAIDEWRFNFYRNSLEKFETVFAAEMRETTSYFVPRRGIYSTPALIDRADDSFPAEIAQFVPEKTRDDWRSAGRCLAFNLLSATGFHVARAVEGTIEVYWQLFSGKPPGTTLNGWNDYVKDLQKIAVAKPTPCPTEKTLAEILQMKDDYRNPIMHPRVVLTETDARMLFDNGESLIIAMACEIKAAKQSGVQPTLTVVAP